MISEKYHKKNKAENKLAFEKARYYKRRREEYIENYRRIVATNYYSVAPKGKEGINE